MVNANTTPEMKRSPRVAKAKSQKPQPGDWVAHPLSGAATILAFGADVPTLRARLVDQKIDPNRVAIYQVPVDDSELFSGGELEFSGGR